MKMSPNEDSDYSELGEASSVFFSIPPSHQGRGGTERELYNLLNFALFRNLKLFVLPISSLIPLWSEKILSRSLLYGQHIFW